MTSTNTPIIKDLSFENVREAVSIHSLFFILGFVGTNFIDNYLKKAFDFIEETTVFKYIFNKESYVWIIFKIIIQLMLITAYIALVRKFVKYVLGAFDTDHHIFGRHVVLTIVGLATFFSQDNLKSYLKKFNNKLDSIHS